MMLTLLLSLSVSAFAAPQWHDTLGSALADAKAAGKPVLMDFQAPWCYSCYYMEKHVLDGEPFSNTAKQFVLLKLDVDKEEGHALREKWRVTGLPSYLVMSSGQEELGRVIGEQTEKDFISQLGAILAKGSADPMDAAVASFKKSFEAGDYEGAQREAARAEKKFGKPLAGRADWRLLNARLELMRAVRDKDARGVEALKKTLALDDSCDVADYVYRGKDLVEQLKPEARKPILALERTALEKLADARIFVPVDKRCADIRSGVEMLATVYEKLGEKAKRDELAQKTVAFLEKQNLAPGEDRNYDDNRAFFLELANDERGLRDWYPKLIAAYPSDFVYNYRWAKRLVEHGKAAEALPLIEKSDKLAYGANRYRVTGVRAKALADLGRRDEALSILKRDSKALKKSFAKESAALDLIAAQIAK